MAKLTSVLILLSLAGSFASAAARADDKACLPCHAPVEAVLQQKNTHAAVGMGCATCHVIHADKTPAKEPDAVAEKPADADAQPEAEKPAVVPPPAPKKEPLHLVSDVPGLCLTCHDAKTEGIRAAHRGQPFETARCNTCHDPHASNNAKLIREVQHQPFAERKCATCHQEPVNGKVVLRAASTNDLCLECHSSAGAEKLQAPAAATLFAAKVTVEPGAYKDIREVALEEGRGHPVSNHPVLRKEDKDGPELRCGTCHATHAANTSSSLLVTEQKTSESLCFRCHN